MTRYEVYGQQNDGDDEAYPSATFVNFEDAKKYALEKKGK